MSPRLGVALFRQAFAAWREDQVPRLAAALAYYTAFSLAPLLIVLIAIAGLAFGREAAQGQLLAQLRGLIGSTGAQGIETLVKSAAKPSSGLLATVVGAVTLLLGASGVFGQLQDALNVIWDAPAKKTAGLAQVIKDRFLSFTIVVGTGFLLMVSLVANAALAALQKSIAGIAPQFAVAADVIGFALSLVVFTVLFAAIFKVLPDVKIVWSDVWTGALATALLFIVGQWLLGLYLGKSAVASSYGAAGSLMVILLWVYYSAQILLFGAEFTKVYANEHGTHALRPSAPQAGPADRSDAAAVGARDAPVDRPGAEGPQGSDAGRRPTAAGTAGEMV